MSLDRKTKFDVKIIIPMAGEMRLSNPEFLNALDRFSFHTVQSKIETLKNQIEHIRNSGMNTNELEYDLGKIIKRYTMSVDRVHLSLINLQKSNHRNLDDNFFEYKLSMSMYRKCEEELEVIAGQIYYWYQIALEQIDTLDNPTCCPLIG